jgi:hypothetical protein
MGGAKAEPIKAISRPQASNKQAISNNPQRYKMENES